MIGLQLINQILYEPLRNMVCGAQSMRIRSKSAGIDNLLQIEDS